MEGTMGFERSASQRRERAKSLALALIFAASQAATFAHGLFVSHVTCPEHGEMIHATRPGALPSRSSERGPVASSRTSSVDAHDVCSILLHGRDRAVTARHASLRSAPPSCVGLSYEEGPGHLYSLAIFRLAPKNSPPA